MVDACNWRVSMNHALVLITRPEHPQHLCLFNVFSCQNMVGFPHRNRWSSNQSMVKMTPLFGVPSGKHTKHCGKSACYLWENSLCSLPFSVAMLNYQRVTHPFDIRHILSVLRYGFVACGQLNIAIQHVHRLECIRLGFIYLQYINISVASSPKRFHFSFPGSKLGYCSKRLPKILQLV